MAAKKIAAYNKGSILPRVLDIESELEKLEVETMAKAESTINDARKTAVRIVEEAKSNVKHMEVEERDRLLNAVDQRIGEIERAGETEVHNLREHIAGRRGQVLASLLDRVLPDKIPDSK